MRIIVDVEHNMVDIFIEKRSGRGPFPFLSRDGNEAHEAISFEEFLKQYPIAASLVVKGLEKRSKI